MGCQNIRSLPPTSKPRAHAQRIMCTVVRLHARISSPSRSVRCLRSGPRPRAQLPPISLPPYSLASPLFCRVPKNLIFGLTFLSTALYLSSPHTQYALPAWRGRPYEGDRDVDGHGHLPAQQRVESMGERCVFIYPSFLLHRVEGGWRWRALAAGC
ncbi:hypothetical protein B0H16DRAFT_121526 [Mycena metata]|uniref:Uncharacterized protein n=1 Tax=Mycena metata TaxID=1033252 RepID=A0AAD7MXL8_9AGAR|nr:hypothetical protein B0H16DRAFT_121526 [Mycena metata]